MPDGEMATAPMEDSVESYVSFSYPALYTGCEVTGVRLWFENGDLLYKDGRFMVEF